MTAAEAPAPPGEPAPPGAHPGSGLLAGHEATEPPEARGLARDQVRLLVATPAGLTHARFHELGSFLRAGDLLVVNTSATVPAALDGRRADGRPVVVHLSTRLDDGTWVVELRRPEGDGPQRDGRPNERVSLKDGAALHLLAPRAAAGEGARLWRARLHLGRAVGDYLAAYGRPIAYSYLGGRWPIEAYQTVFAREPGSAEMASAGRPFSVELVTALVAAGVVLTPITLHAGVSSLEPGEPPQPERYSVPASTARLVNHTRETGGRVVAIGTTVTRALESAASPDGSVRAASGWTDLVLGPDRPARVVDGLVTGWHDLDASHLLLLQSVAGRELVERSYAEALATGYLWHEFGDSCLLLPDQR